MFFILQNGDIHVNVTTWHPWEEHKRHTTKLFSLESQFELRQWDQSLIYPYLPGGYEEALSKHSVFKNIIGTSACKAHATSSLPFPSDHNCGPGNENSHSVLYGMGHES